MNSKMLGKRIKEVRCRRNLSQSELSEYIGVGTSTVCEYESGNKTPSLNNFIKIAEYLGCSPNELLQDYLPIDNQNNSFYYRSIIKSLHQLSLEDLESAAIALEKINNDRK